VGLGLITHQRTGSGSESGSSSRSTSVVGFTLQLQYHGLLGGFFFWTNDSLVVVEMDLSSHLSSIARRRTNIYSLFSSFYYPHLTLTFHAGWSVAGRWEAKRQQTPHSDSVTAVPVPVPVPVTSGSTVGFEDSNTRALWRCN